MISSVSNMITKSKIDDREYRYIKLNNSLRCLLVHDQDVEKSSACMFVASGTLADPKLSSGDGAGRVVEGLAHFCEHMLFLGTKKYPNENQYSEFI